MGIDDPATFHGIDDLISRIESFQESDDWIYINAKKFNTDLVGCTYYYLPEDWIATLPEDEVYTDDEGLEMPVSVKGLDLKGWLLASDLATLASVSRKEIDPRSAFIAQVKRRERERPEWSSRNI